MTSDNKRNNGHSQRNKGISPVLGTIIFVLVAVAAIGTISFIFMAQDNYNTAVKKSTELVGNKGKEQISAVQLEEAKLQIANDGPATSRIIGLMLVDDSSGNLSLKPLNLALPSAQKLDYTIPDSTTGGGLGSGKMGLLTSLGNIFWVDSKPLQNKPLPDFAIAIAPDSLTVEQGKTGTASITVSPLNSFSDTVFLSASGLPQGTSYLVKPSSGNLMYTSALTVQVGSTTPVGVYTISITGDDKNGRVHSATLTLQVNAASKQDFTLSASSKTVTLQQSSSATNSVTVSPVNGYDRTVMLETSGFPAGVTYSYNPLSAKPPFTSTLTMGSAANTPAGTYVITVKGSDDTGKIHSDTFTLQITAQPDFDLSVNPSSLNLQSGGSGSSVVSVTSLNGYSGQVSLSLSGLPSGAAASFSKPSGSPSFTSVLDINAGTANPGTYNLIVTGTGSIDGKTKSTQLTLAIQETSIDFSLALSSGSVNVQQGGSGSNTVTVSPVNGYNKVVSLSASGIPSRVSASFSPQSGIPAFTSTMSMSASTSAKPGSYPVTVQAQGQDGKTHSATFTLKVQAKYQLTISVQTAGPSVAPTTFISDTFSTGLDGWSYWGDGGYSLTRDTGTGSPAPSAKISGDAFATVHGMQKVVDLSSWPKTGTLTLSFNYRAASDYAGSTVTNAFIRIYNADTGQILYEETLVAGGTQDTGWKSYSKDITCSVLSSSGSSTNKIRVVLFLGDGWSANWNQKNWYDNINLESSASAATTCGGTTSPAPGTYSYVEGESVQVTALPNAGWKLSYWSLDGVIIGSQNPASVTMNKDHELAAVFAQGQSGSDFVVSASPSSLSIAKGSSGSTTVLVNSINGYSTGVSLSLSGLPSGATSSFLPWSSNAPFTSTLTINAGTANVGTYTLSITGSGLADGKIRTTTVTLTITPQFDFSLALNPSSGTVQQGGTVQTTVTTTLQSGTSSTVSLSASGGPPGTTFTFGPASGNPTFASTLTISIPSNAATGTYQVTVTGSGGGVSRTATYQLTVNPQTTQTFNYALSVSPSSLSITKGSSAQTTVSVDLLAGSSAQAVALSSTGQPSGVTVSFNPSSGNPTFKSTMSIGVSSAANAGTYTLTITGTSGALAKSTTLTLTIVNAADFTLSATPSTLTVQQGSAGSTTVKVDALNGYSNTVSLSATGPPSGVTYAFSPSSGKPTFSSTLTLSASQSAATGTFTVTISGAGTDGKTRTTTLTLTIPKQTTYQLVVPVKDQFNSPVKGITISVDSSSYTTDTSGQVAVQVPKGTHTIAVPSSYLQSSGTRYLFEKWGDGGITANPRTVTVNSAVTFTALEKKQHYLTMQVSPSSSAGTVSPSTDWYDSGKQVTISASASSGYKFDKWSGSGSGSYSGTANPATITINAPITETAGFQQVYTLSVKTLATYGSLSTSPLSGLKVKIGSSTVQTDSNGVATFALPAGTYHVSVVDTSTTKSISSVDVRGFAFEWWDNLSTSNPRTISVNGPSTLVAYYPITWQQYTLNPNTYTAEVADPSQTDSLGNPVLRSVSLPYAKSASNWLLGWEWSMDVRTDSKGAYYGAHDYAVWGYTKAFTTKWNSKFTPATHSYAVDKLAISYSGYLNVKGMTSDSDQGLYFRYRDTYNNKGDTSPSVDWTNTKSYNGVVGAARVFTPKQVIVGDLLVSTYQWTRGSNFDMRFSNGYGWTTNNMVATLYFTSTNP